MKGFVKRIVFMLAIVLLYLAAVVFLFTRREYLIASILLGIFVAAWFSISFVFNKRIGGRYFEERVLRYLKANNGQATIDELSVYFGGLVGAKHESDAVETMRLAVGRLEKSKKVAVEGRTVSLSRVNP